MLLNSYPLLELLVASYLHGIVDCLMEKKFFTMNMPSLYSSGQNMTVQPGSPPVSMVLVQLKGKHLF